MARIVVLQDCEHGQMEAHGSTWSDQSKPRPFYCPGGSRRVLDPGSYVLPDGVVEAAAKAHLRAQDYRGDPTSYDLRYMRIALQAALKVLAGGEQP